jgi:hypothetical protein
MTSTNNSWPDVALSRWDYEGGAGPDGPQEGSSSRAGQPARPRGASDELERLRARIIGLENVVIALLAEATEHQLDLVRDMAMQISPKQGASPHRLTTDAAGHMTSIVERARRARDRPTQGRS